MALMKTKVEQPATAHLVPDLAWRYNFGGGALAVSWEACLEAAPDPLAQVKANPGVQNSSMRAGANGLPGINMLWLGRKEADRLKVGWPHKLLPSVPGLMDIFIRRGQVDIVLAPAANLRTGEGKRLEFLKKYTREDYPGEVGAFLHQNGSEGFKQLIAEVIIDTTRFSLIEIYSMYSEKYPTTKNLGYNSQAAAGARLGNLVARNLEAVFFDHQHPRYTGTAKPSL